MRDLVYILEDDTSICGLIKVALEMNGIDFNAYSTAADFLSALRERRPDVALLDIMLPDGNGLDVLKEIKGKYPDVVNGLNLGADDYVAKPFSVLELTARVKAQLRRKSRKSVMAAGGITLDCETMTAELDGEPLPLSKKEFDLLKYFVENAGKALTRDKILSAVWGYDFGETRTLDNHVARLRKLGVKIETMFGTGYRFNKY